MLLDDGILWTCSLTNAATKGSMPKKKLQKVTEYCYGERIVGYGRQYAAKGVNEQVDMLVRIWQDRSIRIGMYALVNDEEQFRIDNVQHLTDEDGLKVTDLTLRRVDDLYDVE